MICSRCTKPMKEEKRSFHKKRKWQCLYCGRTVMQYQKAKKSCKNS